MRKPFNQSLKRLSHMYRNKIQNPYLTTMSTMRDLPHTILPFTYTSGSVPGRDHVRSGKNNQDALSIMHTDRATVAVVTDGCSSGTHTEIGATLGARLACIEVLRALHRYTPENQHLLFDHPNHWEWREGIPGRILAKIETLMADMETSTSAWIQDHLLFTIVGVLMTNKLTAFFSLGDGLLEVNGETVELESCDANTPPYLAYRLVKTHLPRESLILNVHHVLPTDQLKNFLLATDGLHHMQRNEMSNHPGTDTPIGPLSQFWTDPCYRTNRDKIRRKLAACSTDITRLDTDTHSLVKYPGLLPDDTTLIVGVRNESSAL